MVEWLRSVFRPSHRRSSAADRNRGPQSDVPFPEGSPGYEYYRGSQPRMPEAPGVTPAAEDYLRTLREGIRNRPGYAYRSPDDRGAFYRDLQDQVTEQMRKTGWKTGGDLASRGGRATGAYGAGMRARTEQEAVEARARTHAAAVAQRAAAEGDLQYYNQLLRGVQAEQNISNQEFEQEFRRYLEGQRLSEAEIEREMEKWRMILGFTGQAGRTVAELYAGGAGG